jgi:hypothetical protein
MGKNSGPIQFRPTPEDNEHLDALQRYLQARVPGVRVSRSDVMRYALQQGASNIRADLSETSSLQRSSLSKDA